MPAVKINITDAPFEFFHEGANGSARAINIPQFNVAPYRCSNFCRVAARELFGLEYATCNAWDRIYMDKFAWSHRLPKPKEFTQGTIFGVYFPYSPYASRRDIMLKPIPFTHNALFIGKNNGDDFFLHQVDEDVFVESLDSLKQDGLELKYAFLPTAKKSLSREITYANAIRAQNVVRVVARRLFDYHM